MPPKKTTKPKSEKKQVRKVAKIVPNYLCEWQKKSRLKEISKSLEILQTLDNSPSSLDEETKNYITDLMKKMISGKVINEDEPTKKSYFYEDEEEDGEEKKD